METKSEKNENIMRMSETRLEKLETNFILLVNQEVTHLFFVWEFFF